MPIMTWDATLDIGVEAMNSEHRDILDAMNRVFDMNEAGRSGAPMMAEISRLGAITTRHFRDEEVFMAKCGFPDLEPHKRIHAKLLADFATHASAAEAAGGKPSREFFQFLRLWLSAHIRCMDRKYADHAVRAHAR